jgi:diguanylate cyclase (GGDEF)-like protein
MGMKPATRPSRWWRIIRSTIRESDFASRFGGEEFLVLLPNTDRATGLLVAEKLRVEIGHAELAGVAAISASLGVSVMPADATTADGLLRNADRALYVAKESRTQPRPLVLVGSSRK